MQNTTLCPVGRLLRFLVMSPHYPLHAPCRQGKTPGAVVANARPGFDSQVGFGMNYFTGDVLLVMSQFIIM